MARRVVARFHGEAAAVRELERFEHRFQRREVPADRPRFVWQEEVPDPLTLAAALAAAGLSSSLSEARRLIRQGAVRVDGERVVDPQAVLSPKGASVLLQVGRRRICEVFFENPGVGA